MPQSNHFDYIQTVIGDCGHVADKWPERTSFTSPLRPPEYICMTCTIETYGLEAWEAEGVAVWVREKDIEVKKAEKRVRREATRERKQKEWNPTTKPMRKDGLW